MIRFSAGFMVATNVCSFQFTVATGLQLNGEIKMKKTIETAKKTPELTSFDALFISFLTSSRKYPRSSCESSNFCCKFDENHCKKHSCKCREKRRRRKEIDVLKKPNNWYFDRISPSYLLLSIFSNELYSCRWNSWGEINIKFKNTYYAKSMKCNFIVCIFITKRNYIIIAPTAKNTFWLSNVVNWIVKRRISH